MTITKTSTKIAKAFVLITKKLRDTKKIGNTLMFKQDGVAVMRVKDSDTIVIDEEGYTYFKLDSKVAVDRVNAYLHEIRAEANLAWIEGKPHAWTGEWTPVSPQSDLTSLVSLAYA